MREVITSPTEYTSDYFNKDVVIVVDDYSRMAPTVTSFVDARNSLRTLEVQLVSGISNANLLYGFLDNQNIPVDVIGASVVPISPVQEEPATEETTVEADYKPALIQKLRNLFSRRKNA